GDVRGGNDLGFAVAARGDAEISGGPAGLSPRRRANCPHKAAKPPEHEAPGAFAFGDSARDRYRSATSRRVRLSEPVLRRTRYAPAGSASLPSPTSEKRASYVPASRSASTSVRTRWPLTPNTSIRTWPR